MVFTQRLSVPVVDWKAAGGDARWLAEAMEVVPQLRTENLKIHHPRFKPWPVCLDRLPVYIQM